MRRWKMAAGGWCAMARRPNAPWVEPGITQAKELFMAARQIRFRDNPSPLDRVCRPEQNDGFDLFDALPQDLAIGLPRNEADIVPNRDVLALQSIAKDLDLRAVFTRVGQKNVRMLQIRPHRNRLQNAFQIVQMPVGAWNGG